MLARHKKRYLLASAWIVLLFSGLVFCCKVFNEYGSSLNLLYSIIATVIALILVDNIMRRSNGVPVLIYHSISNDSAWLPWAWGTSIEVNSFQQQLDVLKANNYSVISTYELIRLKKTGESLPYRPVIIHFDDGYLDNHVAAAPLLSKYNFPATFYVSTDFIEPGILIRHVMGPDVDRLKSICWSGYMNHLELKALDANPLFDVESHGGGHGRVQISDRPLTLLSKTNWRHLSWLQWDAFSPKSDWFKANKPMVVNFGEPIFEHDSELTGRRWLNGAVESQEDYESRVVELLTSAKNELQHILGREITQLCWPFDRVTVKSHQLALQVGFIATTGGKGCNASSEPADIISRLHICDYGWGWRWSWGEKLLFHAKLRLFQGNMYWLFLVLMANLLRKLRHKLAPLSVPKWYGV